MGAITLFDVSAYENAAEFVKAISHEKRLQLIELLRVQEHCVEDLTTAMGIGFKSVSAHLRVMKKQGILTTRKEGKRVYYRLRNHNILDLYEHILEVALQEETIAPPFDGKVTFTLRELLEVIQSGHVQMIDVRTREEYANKHIPGALSVPIDELISWSETFQSEDKLLIVYCEGFYCIQAIDAMKILAIKGFRVKMYRNGLTEWSAAGYSTESTS